MKNNNFKPIFTHILIYSALAMLSFFFVKFHNERDLSLDTNAYNIIETLNSYIFLLLFSILGFFLVISGKRLNFDTGTLKSKTLILIREFINLLLGYAFGILLGVLTDIGLYRIGLYGQNYKIVYTIRNFLMSSIILLIFYFFLYILRYVFSFVKHKGDFDVQMLFISVLLILVSFIFSSTKIGLIVFFISFLEMSYIFISSVLIRISELSDRLDRRITYLRMFLSKRRIFIVIISIFYLYTTFTVFNSSFTKVNAMYDAYKHEYVVIDSKVEDIEKAFDSDVSLTLKEVYGDENGIIGSEKIDVIYTSYSDLSLFYDLKLETELKTIPDDSIIIPKSIGEKNGLKIGTRYDFLINNKIVKLTVYGYNASLNDNFAFSNRAIDGGDKRVLIKTNENIKQRIKDESLNESIRSVKDYEKDFFLSLDIRRFVLFLSILTAIAIEILILLIESRNDFSLYKDTIDRMIYAGCKRAEIVKIVLYVEIIEFISCLILSTIPLYVVFGMNNDVLSGIIGVSLSDYKISDGIIYLFEIFSILVTIIIVDSLIAKNIRIERE